MDIKHLNAVEKWTYLLSVLAMASALIFWSVGAALSVGLGSALMAANGYALRRIGERAFATMKRPGAWILLFNLKMMALIGVVFVIVRYLKVDVGPFMVGLSVFPLAVVAVATQHALRTDEEAESNG